MGIISSKFFKHDPKPSKINAAMQTETPRETTLIPDVRSPTANIERTPIIVEKLKCDTDTPKEYRSQSLRCKLLKNLKFDQRSPTTEIYGTPILNEQTMPNNPNQINADSPVSIYSCNYDDSLVDNVMTPSEPSLNVSGFEFQREVFCGESDITVGEIEIAVNEENKSCLKVLEKPNTDEAKKLLEEIISDEKNFLRKVKIPPKKAKKPGPKNTSETKAKLRAPLSNITSSTNSPGNILPGVKSYSRNKIVPESGSENSASPSVKHMVQWDQNNTVLLSLEMEGAKTTSLCKLGKEMLNQSWSIQTSGGVKYSEYLNLQRLLLHGISPLSAPFSYNAASLQTECQTFPHNPSTLAIGRSLFQMET